MTVVKYSKEQLYFTPPRNMPVLNSSILLISISQLVWIYFVFCSEQYGILIAQLAQHLEIVKSIKICVG